MTVNGQAGATVKATIADSAATSVTATGTVGSTGSASFSLNLSSLKDGPLTASATLTDAAGNVGAAGQSKAMKDTVAPTGSFTITGTVINGQLATNNPTLSVQLAFTDQGTGLGQMAFSTDGGTTYGSTASYATSGSTTIAGADGLYTIAVKVTDVAGNSVVIGGRVIRLDTTGPVTSYTITAAGASGWYDITQNITLSYSASDLDNVASVTATLDGNTTIASGGTISKETLSAGTHTIAIVATDGLGNTSTTTVTIQVHETLTSLITAVADGIVRGQIASAVATQLTGPLNSAQNALKAGNTAAAKSYLANFVTAVQAQSGTGVNAAYAALLVGWANDLISRL
jgi:hypothetical protein